LLLNGMGGREFDLYVGINGFLDLSIVRYSKGRQRTQRFGNWICFCLQVRGWGHLIFWVR
jgi:hypothetical protein